MLSEIANKIKRYRNKFHRQNCYLDFNVDEMSFDKMKMIFEQIAEEENCHLQVMCSSLDVSKEKFLYKNDFENVRRCYEMVVSASDLVEIDSSKSTVLIADKGTEIYDKCCRLLFDYYVTTHESINPLTATFTEFITDLPEQVFYLQNHGEIIHSAFVVKNEIAYVCSIAYSSFKSFISSVVRELFTVYHEICFEADDVDWAATQLKNLFQTNDVESYNTWLFKNKKRP